MVPKTLDPRVREDDAAASFEVIANPLQSRVGSSRDSQFPVDPAARGPRRVARAAVSDCRDSSRFALGHPRHFVFCAPTSVSQRRNASTTAFASSVGTCGYCASQPSYSDRPYSRIASWLSFGATDSGTFFTEGPGEN